MKTNLEPKSGDPKTSEGSEKKTNKKTKSAFPAAWLRGVFNSVFPMAI